MWAAIMAIFIVLFLSQSGLDDGCGTGGRKKR